MKSARTWILIADGGHARVLETVGHGNPLKQVPHLALETELPPNRELGTDRLSRSHESVGPTRHAIAPRNDAHRELKRSFAEEIVAALEAQCSAGNFDKLILVAPPATLGDLRQAMGKTLSERVVGEVPKDLVRTPNHEIRAHLADIVVI